MATICHGHLQLLDQIVAGELQRRPAASFAVITNFLLLDRAQPILSDLPAIKSAAPAWTSALSRADKKQGRGVDGSATCKCPELRGRVNAGCIST